MLQRAPHHPQKKGLSQQHHVLQPVLMPQCGQEKGDQKEQCESLSQGSTLGPAGCSVQGVFVEQSLCSLMTY